MTDELNRDYDLAKHTDWLSVFQVDDKIAETTVRIKKLETKKAELQASGNAEAELVSIERDLQYETKHLASLRADRRAMMGYLD